MKSQRIFLTLASLMLIVPPAAAAAQTAAPQFQVEPFWPKPLPNNWLLGQVSGITVDRSNNLWMVHRPGSLSERERAAEQNPPPAKCCVAPPPVLVFSQAGDVIRHWGGPGQGYNWPKSEHGIYIDDNDFVWLAGNDKTDGQLLKFTMDGKFVLQIGKPIQGMDSNSTERLGSPADIAVDVAAKEVYAADGYGNRPARSTTRRPASARRRTSPASCSRRWPASTSCTYRSARPTRRSARWSAAPCRSCSRSPRPRSRRSPPAPCAGSG